MTRRARAVKLGAVEVDRRELVRIMRRLRVKSLFEQMREQIAAEQAKGLVIKSWVIRTDQFIDVERQARADGVFVEEFKTILGVPFEVSDRVESEDGILAFTSGPAHD